MNEKLQAVIGRMQEQIVALTAERDGAREQRDTARAELAAVTEEVDIRDGLMEQVDDEGERADKAEVRIGEMEGEIAAVRGVVEEIRRLCMDVNRPGVPETNVTIYKMADRFLGIILATHPPAAGEPAGGTGEGCPTCKGTHMVSGTHGLDACPVCRPEPAKEFFPVAPSCHHVRALRCEKCGSIPTIPVVLCCSCVDRLFTPAQPGEGGA